MNRTGQFIKLIPLLLALVVVVALPLAACRKAGAPGAGMSPVRNRDFNIEVSISHFPKLYEPFTITATFTPYREDQVDAELWTGAGGLAQGAAVYLDGEWAWHGPLKKGETKVLTATFAFIQEGNSGIDAVAVGSSGSSNEAIPIYLHVTREGSWRNGVIDLDAPARGWKPGDPYPIYPGGEFMDTSLLLNTSPEPRIEIVQSVEDIRQLQEQGLLLQEFRYSWRMFDPRTFNFSQRFLLVFWDGMRPNRGHLALFEGGEFLTDRAVIRLGFRTYSLPPDVPVPEIPTSAVVVKELSYQAKTGHLDMLVFQGTRTFEFTLNGEPFTTMTMELKPATPSPSAEKP